MSAVYSARRGHGRVFVCTLMAQRCRDSSREVCKHKIIQNDKLDVHTDIVADVAEFVRIKPRPNPNNGRIDIDDPSELSWWERINRRR